MAPRLRVASLQPAAAWTRSGHAGRRRGVTPGRLVPDPEPQPIGITELVRAARLEVIPTARIADDVLTSVPRDVALTITASPVKGLEPTLLLTERLAREGYRVVPHVPARLVRDVGHLREVVDRLRAAGVDDVFVPAGDGDLPAGDYLSALPLLADLTALGRPFGNVGITGYPESHPTVDDDLLVQAMWDKRAHATYIVSNLCFDPRRVHVWIARIRRRHVDLPVLLGMAGPVQPSKLVTMAGRIGVGESARFLTAHPLWFLRLARPGGYSPEKLLRACAARGQAETALAGVHIFTFNQVAESEAWRRDLLERLTS